MIITSSVMAHTSSVSPAPRRAKSPKTMRIVVNIIPRWCKYTYGECQIMTIYVFETWGVFRVWRGRQPSKANAATMLAWSLLSRKVGTLVQSPWLQPRCTVILRRETPKDPVPLYLVGSFAHLLVRASDASPQRLTFFH